MSSLQHLAISFCKSKTISKLKKKLNKIEKGLFLKVLWKIFKVVNYVQRETSINSPKHSLSRPHFHHKAVNPLQFQSMTSPYIFIVFMVLYFWKDVLKLSNFIKIFLNILCFLWFDVLKNSPLCSYKSLEVLYFILRTLLWQGIIFIFAKECWFCENKEYPFFFIQWFSVLQIIRWSLTPVFRDLSLCLGPGLLLLVGWGNVRNFGLRRITVRYAVTRGIEIKDDWKIEKIKRICDQSGVCQFEIFVNLTDAYTTSRK